jgi:hypothetical protein
MYLQGHSLSLERYVIQEIIEKSYIYVCKQTDIKILSSNFETKKSDYGTPKVRKVHYVVYSK